MIRPATYNNAARSGQILGSFGQGGVLADITVVQALGVSAAAWPTANMAVYIPLLLWQPGSFDRIKIFNGGTVSGNLDVGIYDCKWNRLASSGSTAQAGANAYQAISITELHLEPGLYFLAIVFDNTTGSLFRSSVATPLFYMLGCRQEAAAFPLPATATPVTGTAAVVPLIMAIGTDVN